MSGNNNKRKKVLAHRESNRLYRINNIEKEKKRCRIKDWLKWNITFGDMTPSEYYDNVYLPATNCDCCFKKFDLTNRKNQKQLDHIHRPEMFCNIRGIICFECNSNDNWRCRMLPNSIYQNYLEQYIIDNTP